VRTLRAKLKLMCQDLGQAMRWNAELAGVALILDKTSSIC